MGDGKSEVSFGRGDKRRTWVPPDGCLCDAAAPGMFIPKQGDGRVDIHDWGMEFTAAGFLLQAEALLIGRDEAMIREDLPKLERCANFIESRRDPKNNLFLAGPAGNLLAPSFSGYKKPDGSYGMAYLTGLSVTYTAALDRLIELENLAGRSDEAKLYRARRDSAQEGLAQLATDEGYFIKSLDPDGTRHGVYGAEKHGYFEASPNHDAVAFRVVDDEQAQKIYAKIASLPGLRPHDFIIANYPGLDDMYEDPEGSWLWSFGTWVNGGHWSTCEARVIMAYYRLGKHDDARRSMKQLLTFARRFRMDNPLVEFGSKVYQPKQPINLCYDSFGPPAALVRGLFEYLYTADGVTLLPHIPPQITSLEQKFPIRLGQKKLYIVTKGSGQITSVLVNGVALKSFDETSVTLKYETLPALAQIHIGLGGARLTPDHRISITRERPPAGKLADASPELDALEIRRESLGKLLMELRKAKLRKTYEAAHARLAMKAINIAFHRHAMLKDGVLQPLDEEESRAAADKIYIETADKLCNGLEATLNSYAETTDSVQKKVYAIWKAIPQDGS